MKNPLQMACGLILALGTVLFAQPAPSPEKIALSSETPKVSSREEKATHMLHPVPDGYIQFYGPNTPVAAKFRFGYFGMPYALSPVTADSEELHMLRKGVHFVFKKDGLGWRFVSKGSLPPPPNTAQVSMDGGKTPDASIPAAPRSSAQETDEGRQVTGYQVDEKGNLYWITRGAIYRNSEGGWRLLLNFPKELSERRYDPACRGYVAVLPRNRLALVGTTDAFIKILELPDPQPALMAGGASSGLQTGEPRLLGSISYKSIGFDDLDASKTPLVNFSSMPFLAIEECLYFYLGDLGRFFRLRLDSFSLTELNTPWVARMDSNTWGSSTSRKWRPSENPPTYPVLPWTIAFAPRPDETVHARALMWNMEPAVIYSFELGSESSSIKADIHMEAEMPEPMVLPDPQGNLVPIKSLIGPDSATAPHIPKANPTPKAADHLSTQRTIPPKEN